MSLRYFRTVAVLVLFAAVVFPSKAQAQMEEEDEQMEEEDEQMEEEDEQMEEEDEQMTSTTIKVGPRLGLPVGNLSDGSSLFFGQRAGSVLVAFQWSPTRRSIST
ncbi:hypothetical protein [Salinibacter ruber]|nr:hypothetical protein [Salinibacter ruber]MCS3616457.1 flagellar biosynthesis component FlhA [Salinibacter ruber]MCS3648269.1 flagellar biosynthesis component FlhA [Salinibacter ruber]